VVHKEKGFLSTPVVFREHVEGYDVGEAVVVDVRGVCAHAGVALVAEGPADAVGKSSVAAVEPEVVIGEKVVGDVDVGPSVVVEIANGDAQAVAVFFDAGLQGDVGEYGVAF